MSDRIDHGSKPWKAIPRDVLRDKRLSHQARGGLVTLLSHEDGWVRSVIAILMKEGRRCGREQAQSIMKELAANGYAELLQKRGSNGRFTTAYTVWAASRSTAGTSLSPPTVQPSTVEPSTVYPAAVVEPQDLEPQVVEPQSHTTRVAAKRDPIWDGFVAWLRHEPEPEIERGKWNAAAKQLRAIGVTSAAEIVRRGAAYQFRYPGIAPTPFGLVAHWSEFGPLTVSNGHQPSRGVGEMTNAELEELIANDGG